MSEENLIPEAAAKTEEKASKSATLPKTIADVQAITHVPTTEATASFARFINKYLTNADNFEGVTEEQAWTVIGIHRVWQQSEERKQELAELKDSKAKQAEEKKAAAAEKKAQREAEAAKKAEEKARKDAEKAAKKAADGEGEDALETLEDVTTESTDDTADEAAPAAEEGGKKNRQRRPRPGVNADGF